jgi:superfamily II DNA/RNA helicase
MQVSELQEVLGPELCDALGARGYDTLTAVQQAVLDPKLAGRDLRIT